MGRLQWTKFKNANEYWMYYGYRNALQLSFKTLISSTIFSISLWIGFSGLFCWYFNIKHISELNDLFKGWAKPLKVKIGTDFEMTQYDAQIDKETQNMSSLEF